MTAAEISQLARRYHAHLVGYTSFSARDHLYRLLPTPQYQSPGSRQMSELLAALRQDPHVEAADFAFTYQIPENAPTALTRPADEALPARVDGGALDDGGQRERFVPNDPKYRYQWHLDQIRMPQAWTYSRGEGVTVAVVDTGVTQVEDLQGTEFVPGWNFVDDGPDARDDHGHGTHVAGTIAQTTHNGVGVAGIAYRARIMPIKVLSGSGSGSINGIAQGIRWATDHGAQVINMSLGGPFNSQVLAKAVRYAHDRGVVVVCAAGNDGRGKVSFPAANLGAIAVAATQYDEATTFYSNWGKEITIAAPGGNTRLDQNNDGLPDGVLQNTVTPGNISKQDYLLFMGTSMASPHIAASAYRACCPSAVASRALTRSRAARRRSSGRPRLTASRSAASEAAISSGRAGSCATARLASISVTRASATSAAVEASSRWDSVATPRAARSSRRSAVRRASPAWARAEASEASITRISWLPSALFIRARWKNGNPIKTLQENAGRERKKRVAKTSPGGNGPAAPDCKRLIFCR